MLPTMQLPPDSCVLLWVHGPSGEKLNYHPSHTEGYRDNEWSEFWFVTDDVGAIMEGPFSGLMSAADWLVGGCDCVEPDSDTLS